MVTGNSAEGYWDYVFLLSNEPVPALVEKVRCALGAGKRVAVAYMSRTWSPLKMDSLEGATLFRIEVEHHSVDFRRFANFVRTMLRLHREVFSRATSDCNVYTDAIDLLAMAQIVGLGKSRTYRFEMRDLHPLQLGNGVVARIVQRTERILLRRVSVLVLTSRRHYDAYYRARFSGLPTYVENVPARSAWARFVPAGTDKFIVGFIGVLRYRQCLETLISAVKQLNHAGRPIHLRIAGGGVIENLASFAGDAPYIEFVGPFNYGADAQRLFADLSLINSVYDADDANVQLAISNKYYEAQITGIPILVADGTLLADLVREAGIGTAARHDDVSDVAAKLAEAFDGGGWYAAARARLAQIEPDGLFARHEAEVAAAVLGPPLAKRRGGATLDSPSDAV